MDIHGHWSQWGLFPPFLGHGCPKKPDLYQEKHDSGAQTQSVSKKTQLGYKNLPNRCFWKNTKFQSTITFDRMLYLQNPFGFTTTIYISTLHMKEKF
jgi:hypothetical protein